MGLQSDFWVGLGKETNYGTAVTPNVFLFGEGGLTLAQTAVEGAGYRPGFRGIDAGRHGIGSRKVSGTIKAMDATIPGGLKTLLEAVLGTSDTTVVDAVNGPVNHYLFTPKASDYLPSYTIQQATPRLGSSTVDVATFVGCQCVSLKVSVKSGEMVGIETEWVGKDQDFTTTAAVPSWPASVDQLAFADGTIRYGTATLTGPTNAALATFSGSALAGIRELELTIKNSLDDNKPTLGSGLVAGRAAALKGSSADLISGSFTREYLDRSLIDDAVAQTLRTLVVTFTGRGPSSTAHQALEFALPNIRLTDPYTPASAGGDVGTSSHKFTGYESSSAKAVLVALRTTE
jgi:hypothetical protein